MKKVTKFLSILLLVAMCMSLFGGSAYAVELEGGNTSSSAPTAVNDGVQFGGDDTYLDGGSSGSTDLEISEEPTSGPILKAPVKPTVPSGGEAEINGTQYETLEKALAAAINKLAQDSALRGEYGRNAEKRVREQFSEENVIKRLYSVLTEGVNI